MKIKIEIELDTHKDIDEKDSLLEILSEITDRINGTGDYDED
jgi:hypothetical protein|tara:strand:+ start:1199 stop:1324 length:126 start_codon:yes stop_codon:yes gene_type:complete